MTLSPDRIAELDAIVTGGGGLSPERMAQLDAIATGVQPAKPNLVEQIGSSPLGQAVGGSINETISNTAKFAPSQSVLSTGAQLAAGGMKIASTPIGVGLNALIPDVAKQAASSGAQSVANAADSTSAGQFVGDTLLQAKDAYGSFAKAHPEAARNINAYTNIFSGLIGGDKATEAVAPIINKIGNRAQDIIAKDASLRAAPKLPEPISQFERVSAKNSAYGIVDQNKEVFTDLGSDYTKILNKAKDKALPSGKFTDESATFNNHLSNFDGLEGRPLTLEVVDQIDRSLGQKVTNAFNSGDKTMAIKLMNVQDDFRDALSGTKAGKTLSDARTLAANDFRVSDLEKIVADSKNYDNSAVYIKNQYRQIAQNPRRLNSYPKDAQVFIKKIAESGPVGDLLGQLGSRLNAVVGGAVGGPVGFAAGSAAGFAGRGVKDAVYINKANKAIAATNEKVRPLIQKYNMQGPQFVEQPKFGGYLPAPTIAVNSTGGAATLASRDVLGYGYTPPNPTIEQIKAMPEKQQIAVINQMMRNRSGIK